MTAEDHDLVLRMGTLPGFVQVLQPVTLGRRRHDGAVTASAKEVLAGTRFLLDRERKREYPGGEARRRERRQILTRHTRPVTFDCLRHGWYRDGVQLYLETSSWHLQLGRWRYLLGFPVRCALNLSCLYSVRCFA
jgi:hypothetical protein